MTEVPITLAIWTRRVKAKQTLTLYSNHSCFSNGQYVSETACQLSTPVSRQAVLDFIQQHELGVVNVDRFELRQVDEVRDALEMSRYCVVL